MPTTNARLREAFARIHRLYDVTEEEYRAIYKMQGGVCCICQVATGKARMLGVDHDHECRRTHKEGAIAGACCVRGLVCTGSLSANTCNRLIARYNADQLNRASMHLMGRGAPARTFLAMLRQGKQPCVRCGWIRDHHPKCGTLRCGAQRLRPDEDPLTCALSPHTTGNHRDPDGNEWWP